MQENWLMKPGNQWEGREVCSGEGFCDDMVYKRQMSWYQASVSSAFHSWLNF